MSADAYGRFLADNPGYHLLTRQRVASYWDCYHRGRYLQAADYPAHTLLAKLDQAARRVAATQTAGSTRGLPRHAE